MLKRELREPVLGGRGVEGRRHVTTDLRSARDEHLHEHIDSIYDELTDGLRLNLRVSDLVYAAAERYPGLVPTRAAIDAERELPQAQKAGLEIDQGVFVAHVLAKPRLGFHLMHAMSQPRAEALTYIDELPPHRPRRPRPDPRRA